MAHLSNRPVNHWRFHAPQSDCSSFCQPPACSCRCRSARSSPPPVPDIPGLPAAARAAAASIDTEKIRAHVRFLSLDLLEGRGPGTRGAELAAEYIATQFALDGLEPAGDNGTYFQRVPLFAVHTIEDKTKFSFVPASGQPVDLAYGTEIVSKDQTGQTSADIDAPIVFVGYGIHAPEYHWNDYAGRDRPEGQDRPDHRQRAALQRREVLQGHGADLLRPLDLQIRRGRAPRRRGRAAHPPHRSGQLRLGCGPQLAGRREELSPGRPLGHAARRRLDSARCGPAPLHLAGLGDLDQAIDARRQARGFHAVELPVRLRAHIESRVRRYVSANVVGRVPGVSSGEQAILYTAHYDHLGIDPDAKGDGIYNGAVDNGTGCGILLELARAYAQSPVRPPHAVYFASVTAEEQGLLGSQYLGMHPPVPAGQIALDLNYDMLLPIGIPRSVSLGGAERIDFWPTVQTVAKAFDLALLPDPTPGAGHYYRSDHFSLARVGIPAFSVDQGDLFEGHDAGVGPRSRSRTTWPTTTTSLPTSTAPTGIFAATPNWRASALCWAGWPATSQSRRMAAGRRV